MSTSTSTIPFSAVVGHDDLRLALLLFLWVAFGGSTPLRSRFNHTATT